MLCTHGKTQKAKEVHGVFAAPKHQWKEHSTLAAASHTHWDSEQPSTGTSGTQLHAGDAEVRKPGGHGLSMH